MSALIVGAIVASLSLVFVLWPIIGRRNAPRSTAVRDQPVAKGVNVEDMVRAARDRLVTCPSCGAIAPEPNARFCSTCGAKLIAP